MSTKNIVEDSIRRAFPERPLSATERSEWKDYINLFSGAPSEEADAYKMYDGRPWFTVPDELVGADFVSIHSLPHVAFNYYLPKIMLVALNQPYELVMQRLVARVIDPSYSIASLTREQRGALSNLLDYYAAQGFFNDDFVAENAAVLRDKLTVK